MSTLKTRRKWKRSQKLNSSERYKSIYERIIKSKIQPPNGLTLRSRAGLHPIGSRGIMDHTELMDEILLEPSSDNEGRPEATDSVKSQKSRRLCSRRMRRNWGLLGRIRRKSGKPRGIPRGRTNDFKRILKIFRKYISDNNQKMKDLIKESLDGIKTSINLETQTYGTSETDNLLDNGDEEKLLIINITGEVNVDMEGGGDTTRPSAGLLIRPTRR